MLRSVAVRNDSHVLTHSGTTEQSAIHEIAAGDRISGIEHVAFDPDSTVIRPYTGPLDIDPDDEITREVPSPWVADSVPSPLGDDEESNVRFFVRGPRAMPSSAPAEPHGIREITGLAGVPTGSTPRPSVSLARHASEPPPALSGHSTRARISCEAARAAREAARREQARTRAVVLAIWGAAVVLSGVLGLLVLAPS